MAQPIAGDFVIFKDNATIGYRRTTAHGEYYKVVAVYYRHTDARCVLEFKNMSGDVFFAPADDMAKFDPTGWK